VTGGKRRQINAEDGVPLGTDFKRIRPVVGRGLGREQRVACDDLTVVVGISIQAHDHAEIGHVRRSVGPALVAVGEHGPADRVDPRLDTAQRRSDSMVDRPL